MGRHLSWLLFITFTSGLVFGAAAMFYLVKLDIIVPRNFDPLPWLFGWLFVTLAWLLGRAGLGMKRRGLSK